MDFNFANNPGQPNYAGPLVNFMAPFQQQQQGQQQPPQRPGQPGQPQQQPPLPGTSFADRLRAFMSQQGGQPGFNTPIGPGPSSTAIY